MIDVMNKRRQLIEDQNGLVAIVVTVILMIVISLITLGFAQVTRREQRQALDNQLATQAFYAAESGVNLAKYKLSQGYEGPKETCGPDATFTPPDYNVSADGSVKITCLLINSELRYQEYQNVGSGSRVGLLKDQTGNNFTEIFIAWENSDQNALSGCTSNLGVFPTLNAGDPWNCSEPLLRVDLVPVNGSLTQDNLAQNQFTAYLYPTTNPANGPSSKPTTVNYVESIGYGSGRVPGIFCTTDKSIHPRYCVARISIASLPPPAPPAPASSQYALRLSTRYGEANVTVYANTSIGPSTLIDGQVEIDSTARAIDIVKRVKTNVSLTGQPTGTNDGPLTVTGVGLCKRYFVFQDGATSEGPANAGCEIN